MKKLLEQSIISENIRKSNFTKAMETLGLNKGRNREIMKEAKEKLIQEQKRFEQQVGKSKEKLEDNDD